MAFEQKPGQGVLFKNQKKEKDTHPDYTGTINIGGNVWRLSAWKKDAGKGPFLSIAASEPFQKEQAPTRPAKKDHDFDF